MPAYRDQRSGVWRYRKRVRLLDGTTPRIEGTPSLNTKLAAEQAERAHIERLLRGEPDKPKKEVPTFEEFVPEFLAICRDEEQAQRGADEGVNPARCIYCRRSGGIRLDRIRYAEIQDYAAIRDREEALEEDRQQPPDRRPAAARRREEARADRSSA